MVEPIRDIDKLNELKDKLREKSLRDYTLFVIGINTALRISDILELKRVDVSGDYIVLFEKKTSKLRKHKINTFLRKTIDEYISYYNLRGNDYLFKSKKTKNPISRKSYWKILKETAESIGIYNIGSHSMRKTFGYHYYKQTKDIGLLQQILNHSNARTTLIYLGISQDVINESLKDFNL